MPPIRGGGAGRGARFMAPDIGAGPALGPGMPPLRTGGGGPVRGADDGTDGGGKVPGCRSGPPGNGVRVP